MSAQERLQMAIQEIIAAGYQLNSEAFEFLIQNAETSDPVTMMNLALQRIDALEDKPMFIEREFLESLIQQPSQTKSTVQEISMQEPEISPEAPNNIEEPITGQTDINET